MIPTTNLVGDWSEDRRSLENLLILYKSHMSIKYKTISRGTALFKGEKPETDMITTFTSSSPPNLRLTSLVGTQYLSPTNNTIRMSSPKKENQPNCKEYEHDPNKPTFFALNQNVAETYGTVSEYITEQDFHLVVLDDLETMTTLYNDAPGNIQHILTKNYGYRVETNEIGIRDSDSTADRTLASYLCNNGHDGYILEHGKTDANGTFHTEIVICNNQDKIHCKRTFSPPKKMKSPPKIVRKSKRILDDEDDYYTKGGKSRKKKHSSISFRRSRRSGRHRSTKVLRQKLNIR